MTAFFNSVSKSPFAVTVFDRFFAGADVGFCVDFTIFGVSSDGIGGGSGGGSGSGSGGNFDGIGGGGWGCDDDGCSGTMAFRISMHCLTLLLFT